jgi:hypothetical protein
VKKQKNDRNDARLLLRLMPVIRRNQELVVAKAVILADGLVRVAADRGSCLRRAC